MKTNRIILLAKTFGCSRFVYNQTLKFSENHYQSKFLDKDKLIVNPDYKSLSQTDRVNYIKVLKDNPDYSWLKEVSSIALQQSVMHLNTAYDRFFKVRELQNNLENELILNKHNKNASQIKV